MTLPSIHDYLSSNYDPLRGSKNTHSNIMFFDQHQFDAEVDAQISGKPVKQVVFVEGIVNDVIYYERPDPHEAKEMYYTHEELDRFDSHYRKEDAIAERLGLSWMDWKNQQPDEYEISFSDDEHEGDHYEDDYHDDSFQF